MGSVFSRNDGSWRAGHEHLVPLPSMNPKVSDSGADATSESVDFNEIFREHGAFVWRVLRGLGTPPEQLEDATQDVFLVVYRRLGEFEARSSVKTWLFSIARHVAANARRRRKRRPEAPLELEPVSSSPDPAANVETARANRFMARFLEELDDAKRAVFLLGVIEGMPAPELALMLGIPVNTVYSRQRAARQAFREALERYEVKG